MTRHSPEPRDFVIRQIGPVHQTSRGNVYMACHTDAGHVAFWGSETNLGNITQIQALELPAKVRAGCIPSNWSQHSAWVPETADVFVVQAAKQIGFQPAIQSPADAEQVTPDELDQWRRRLLRLLERLFGPPGNDGPVARIVALKRNGQIPRQTAALMIAVAELRNVAEHEGKPPTEEESRAARSSWAAVREWAKSKGVDADTL